MKKFYAFLVLFLLMAQTALAAAPTTIQGLSRDGVVIGPNAYVPFDEQLNSGNYSTYKGKLSDQVWQNIKSKRGKTTGAICDGTLHRASEYYASLALLQADYSTANALDQSIDQIVVGYYLSNGIPFYIPEGTCMFNYESTYSGKTVHWRQHPKAIVKATSYVTGKTAQAGSSTTMTLATDAIATNDLYNGLVILITSGTGAGQSREITDYVGSTKVATVGTAWFTNPDNTSVYTLVPAQLFSLTDSTVYLYDTVTVDLNQIAQTFIYLNGNATEVEIFGRGRFYAYNAGSETYQAVNLVSPIWMNGKIGQYDFDEYECYNLHSLPNGQFGDNIGSARCFVGTPASSSAKIAGHFKRFIFDTTGSDAEELDIFNMNVNAISPSHTIIEYAEIGVSGKVRRVLKNHSHDLTVLAQYWYKSSDFVTAPSAGGSTNVGEKNLTGIDFAGSGQGSIQIGKGILDVSMFPTGYTSSAGCSDCYIKATDTEFVGAVYDIDRYDPETEITGTATAGGASTITLDPATSSSTNSYYNAATIAITAGTGTGQTATISGYVGSTRVVTVSAPWSTQPDNTSVYHIYKAQTGSPVTMSTGTSDSGSGCLNCYFKEGVVPFQMRGYDGFLENSYFDDPVKYAPYVNTSSGRTGCRVQNNTITTKTSGRLNDASGVFPIQVCDKILVSGNRLIQRGNTNHRPQFITLRTAGITGDVWGNSAPDTADGGTVDTVYKTSAANVRQWGNKGNMESFAYTSTTSANNITTGEDTLHTTTLRPQALTTTNSGIIIEGAGTFANNANAKTLKVYLGTGTPINLSLTTSVAGSYDYQVQIWSTGSSTQAYKYRINYTGASGNLVDFGTGTLTQTDTGTLVAKSTGEGVATNDIVEKLFTVKLAN